MHGRRDIFSRLCGLAKRLSSLQMSSLFSGHLISSKALASGRVDRSGLFLEESIALWIDFNGLIWLTERRMANWIQL